MTEHSADTDLPLPEAAPLSGDTGTEAPTGAGDGEALQVEAPRDPERAEAPSAAADPPVQPVAVAEPTGQEPAAAPDAAVTDATASAELAADEQPEGAASPDAEAPAPAEQASRPGPGQGPVIVAQPPPGAGPVIVGHAPVASPPRGDRERPQRPKRRRLNATQRHRNVFFARLNEFRRSSRPEQLEEEVEAAQAAAAAEAAASVSLAVEAPVEAPADGPAGEVSVEDAPAAMAGPVIEDTPAPDAPAVAEVTDDAPAEVPAEDAPAATATPVVDDATADPGATEHPGDDPLIHRQQRRSTPPPPVDRPRLVAAIDRAGGPEVILEALQPKRDENDQPLKWATVCADACKGLKAGDPVFNAWVRLAGTPVSAIKAELGLPDERRGSRGGGRGAPQRGGGRDGGRGFGGRDDRGSRRPREERVSREDLSRLGTGGRVGANIRIIGLDNKDEKQERDRRRKEEREAKRQAERDRLARLGY